MLKRVEGGNKFQFKQQPFLPEIAMISISLYSDGQYPKGLSVLYKLESLKTMEFNYIEQDQSDLFDEEYGYEDEDKSQEKQSVTLNYNEYVRQIDLWKHENVLEKVTIYIGNKLSQTATRETRGTFNPKVLQEK